MAWMVDCTSSPVKRTFPGQGLIEDDTKRPDIGTVIDRLGLCLLGRHIGDRPDHLPDLGMPGGVGKLGQAEIQQLHRPSVRRP